MLDFLSVVSRPIQSITGRVVRFALLPALEAHRFAGALAAPSPGELHQGADVPLLAAAVALLIHQRFTSCAGCAAARAPAMALQRRAILVTSWAMSGRATSSAKIRALSNARYTVSSAAASISSCSRMLLAMSLSLRFDA